MTSKRLTASQFNEICQKYGKSNFLRRPIDMRPGRHPLKNKQLKDIISWLDKNCVQPYYVTKEWQSNVSYTNDVVFYFMDPQDKMIFTLCFCELFN